jgi:hypothetical protein
VKGKERTWSEACAAHRAEPGRWKVAIYSSNTAPISESEGCTVLLYATVKGAEEDMREIYHDREGQGWKRIMGGLSRGIIGMKRGDQEFWFAIDRRGLAKRRSDSA